MFSVIVFAIYARRLSVKSEDLFGCFGISHYLTDVKYLRFIIFLSIAFLSALAAVARRRHQGGLAFASIGDSGTHCCPTVELCRVAYRSG